VGNEQLNKADFRYLCSLVARWAPQQSVFLGSWLGWKGYQGVRQPQDSLLCYLLQKILRSLHLLDTFLDGVEGEQMLSGFPLSVQKKGLFRADQQKSRHRNGRDTK